MVAGQDPNRHCDTVPWPVDQGAAPRHFEAEKEEADAEDDNPEQDEELPYFPGSELFAKEGVEARIEIPEDQLVLVEPLRAVEEAAPERNRERKNKVERKEEKEKKRSKKADRKEEDERDAKKAKVGSDSVYEGLDDVDVNDPRYAFDSIPGVKNFPSYTAIEEMGKCLRRWQHETGSGDAARPRAAAWYHKLRCRMIDLDLLQPSHNWDICKTRIISILQKLANEKSAAARSASAVDVE